MKRNPKILLHLLSLFTVSLVANNSVHSQLVHAASNTTAANPLQFCNGITCPTPGQTIVSISAIQSLNADMVTIEDNGVAAASYPGYFGINGGAEDNIWGVTFSGVSNADITNASGFTLGVVSTGSITSLPLPQWGSVYASNTANDPDIALGTCYSTQSSSYEHFALVVYEDGGEIYMEHYEINIMLGNISTNPPAPFICPFPPPSLCAMNLVRTQLSNSGGTASKPHIEIWHSSTIPVSSGLTIATNYAVVWEQDDPNNLGQRQVWGIDGVIDDPGGLSFPTANNYFAIGDGKQPDVVAVNHFDPGGAAGTNTRVAYVTYLNDNRPTSTGRDILLSDWDYNTQTVNSTITLNTSSTANDDEFEVPRISGPMYYDINTPSSDDPLCVVVVNDNDANSLNLINKVSAYKVYHSSITSPGPIIEHLDFSDHNNTDGFSNVGQTAIMPAVTGVGKEVYNLAGLTAYDDYPTVFYSDYGGSADGDFYAFGLDRINTSTTPVLWGGSDYWEINFPAVSNSSTPFTMAGVRPAVAAATANNSGYNLITTYYEGDGSDRVVYALTGTTATYAFKPGKPTGVQLIDESEVAVYPNPVKDRLNITNADAAGYTVLDVTGRTLATGNLSGSKAGIDVSSLVPGMYMLHISKDGHTEQVKFVKQ